MAKTRQLSRMEKRRADKRKPQYKSGKGVDKAKDFEMSEEEISKKFEEWKKDDSRIKSGEFDDFELLGNNVVVEMFKITPEETSRVAVWLGDNQTKKDIVNYVVYPFAKVLKVGTNPSGEFTEAKAGDIYIMSDSITALEYNPAYLAAVAKENSNDKFVYTDNISTRVMAGITELQQYRFFANKFANNLRPMDLVTFKLPLSTTYFQGKVKK